MTAAAMRQYVDNKEMPSGNTYIENTKLPASASMADTVDVLQVLLDGHEKYRAGLEVMRQGGVCDAKSRAERVAQVMRAGRVTDLYAVWHDGTLIKVARGDTVVAGSELRLRSTEDVALARQVDKSWCAGLPGPALEALSASVSTAGEILVAAQHVGRPLKHLIVVVDGWV